MSVTRRNIILGGLSGFATVALSGCGESAVSGGSSGGGAGPVNIGFMAPKSGPYAQLGTYLDEGVKLYMEQHGSKLGGREVNLVTVDEGADPKAALPELRKLIQQEKVAAVVGVLNSGVAAAGIPTLTNAEVPLLTTANDYGGEYPFWWNVGWGNFGTTLAITDYIVSQAKGESVYLLASDYTGGHGVNGQIRDALKKQGVKIAGEVYTPYGSTKDYQPYLSKVKASGAKHVFAFYAGAEAILFVKQWAQFGLGDSAQLYSNFALTEGVLQAQGEAAEGIITVANYSTGLDNEANKAFVEAYSKKFDAQPTVYAEAMFGALTALDAVIDKIEGEVTGKAIQEQLAGGQLGDLESPRGTWRFDDANGPEENFYILEVKSSGGEVAPEVIKDAGIYGTKGNRVS